MSHIDRMQVELRDLTDKIVALDSFIGGSPIFPQLEFAQQELMVQQLDAMKAYQLILSARIDLAIETE
ncbi:hypothetical protein [Aeromonas phage Riv-10]|uniref:Uncharacterized protein n=2 Tax=Biquartavirus 44RR2 TaxID=115987 RepID=Q6U9I7_9CAUD|nr:hypothetical protein ST44RRORF115c [Aeromonas phage 44RR2.8t]AAQ81434.1 hypothetical protein 44RRORF115c [Aeromonas phage 44RR2.8t]APU00587.1 hypothetical protein [Aeromonas phage 44RR2.8t.2]APU02169.1 hypothetical protein [Aeromonas phage Riv-10]